MADKRRKVRPGALHRLRRHEDPTLSDDPAVVAVLDQLAAAAREHATITPRGEFRAELRAQLVAITPRIVAESAAEAAPALPAAREADAAAGRVAVLDRPRPAPRPATDSPASRTPRRGPLTALRQLPLGKPLAVVASLVTVLALVLGGAVWMSRDSVPGDTLYGLKRASERVELSFADDDSERADYHLQFATTRVQEARTLISRASSSAAGSGPLADGRLSAKTASLVTSALATADGDTRDATSLLGTVAVDSASPAPLHNLVTWLPEQMRRLADLRAAAGSDSKVDAATAQSVALLRLANSRANALAQRVDCDCLAGAPTDDFGPLPVTRVPIIPGGTATTTVPGGTATTTAPGRNGATGGNGSGSNGGNGGNAGNGGSGTATTPGGILPTQVPTELPTNLPTELPTKLPTRLPTELPTKPPSSTNGPGVDVCKINVLGVRVCVSKSN